MLYVIGGNLQQATEYIHRKRVDARAVNDPAELRELRAPEVVLVGTYITRPDVQAFNAVLESVGASARFSA
jgi:hypothetical protein